MSDTDMIFDETMDETMDETTDTSVFTSDLMCFSHLCCSDSEKTKRLKNTNKILLPESVLYHFQENEDFEDILSSPMFFKVINKQTKFGHVCGVEEFTSPPGVCHIPYHVMSNISVKEGDSIEIQLIQPPKGDFIKFRFHTSDFPNLPNSKEILEKIISSDYPVITQGNTISLSHLNEVHLIDVIETKPSEVIKILNTNINVDFDTPLDDTGDIPNCPDISFNSLPQNSIIREDLLKKYKPWKNGFVPFSGKGNKLGTE